MEKYLKEIEIVAPDGALLIHPGKVGRLGWKKELTLKEKWGGQIHIGRWTIA